MKVILPALGLLLLFSCKKGDSVSTAPEQETETTTLSTNLTEIMPGDAVIIRSDKKITASEVDITFNSATVKGYAMKDTAYVFYVPVVTPGPVTVSIPGIAKSNTLQLTVKDYTPITDPQAVINDFVDKRNKAIEAITKEVAGNNFQPSAEAKLLLSQIKDEWEWQMSRLSPSDKQMLAYVLQKNAIDPTAFSFTEMPAGSFARINGDVGDQLVATAKEYVTYVVSYAATVPALLTSGGVFLLAPNPVTAVVFLGVFTTFVITREAATRKANEVGRLKGVAEAVTESYTQRVAAEMFEHGQEKEITMYVQFRNLIAADAGLQNDLAASFSKENEFMSADQEVKSVYTSAATKLEKLKTPYPSYTKIIGAQSAIGSDVKVEGAQIIVKGASDPRVEISSRLDGSTMKVKASSTAKAESINFNLEVAYRRSIDGKEFTKTIPCVVKPEPLFELTGLWKLTYYEDGTRSTFSQEDLVDFASGAGDPAFTLSYVDHLGKTHDLSNSRDRWFIQTFYPETSRLELTHNYWNIRYRFIYDKDNPNVLLGESIGASNKGFNMILTKQ